MCSTSCECADVVERIPNNDQDVIQSQACRKCQNPSFIILDKVHAECKTCFLESCNKKIRSTIGKSKLLKNNDAILVAYSGGASSSVLLDLLKCSIEYEGRREQKFRPSIIHVETFVAQIGTDEKEQVFQPEQQRLANTDKLLDSLYKAYPLWTIYWTTLEMSSLTKPLYKVYQPKSDIGTDLFDDSQAINQFYEELEGRDMTERQKFIEKSVIKLIDHVAEREQFPFVFTGSCVTQLANDLLVDVILGQGASIHSSVDFCDRSGNVPLVRPIKDFTKKEIAFYLRARNLDYHVQTNFASLKGHKFNIQKLTESFLSKLSIDYPSTYSTLIKTGTKLQDESNK